VKSLTWQQVNAWRLSQQYLTHRLQPEGLIQVVQGTLGVHAQLMSAAELAIGARVEHSSPQDVQAALWQDHSLLKTWAMRKTLHLIAAADLPLYVAARQLTDIDWPHYFGQVGISKPVLDAYLENGPEILSYEPITRQQFAGMVYDRLKSLELRDYILADGWGMSLKPLAWRGELCLGPSIGQTATYVRPSAWIGPWKPMEPEAALRVIVRRYLQAFGPATLRNFRFWWEAHPAPAKMAFNSLADEIEEVDVEGWHAMALRATLQSMQEMEAAGVVHLLPMFDAYTLGLTRGEHLQSFISLADQKKVFRTQGWVSAVVLMDGFIKGTWEYKPLHSSTSVKVNLFSPAANGIREGVAVEADRLGKFLNSPIALEFIEN
jgi:hypothetical protein